MRSIKGKRRRRGELGEDGKEKCKWRRSVKEKKKRRRRGE